MDVSVSVADPQFVDIGWRYDRGSRLLHWYRRKQNALTLVALCGLFGDVRGVYRDPAHPVCGVCWGHWNFIQDSFS